MRRFRRSNEVQDLDISPLIDVVFILLIFFMVSTTFVRDSEIDIDRPTASSATQASADVIRVAIDKSSNVFVDGQPIKIWALQSKLRDLLADSTENSVLVITDEGVPVRTLISVVDEARLSGAAEVAVATARELGQS